MARVSGGVRFTAKLREVMEKLGKGGVIRAGFLEGATYDEEHGSTPVALVALVQNYGSPTMGIPPRPFFTNAIANNSGKWGDDLVKIIKAKNDDVELAMGLMGARIVGQIQTSIKETIAPPLSEATIARKGFAKPLIDTSTMYNAVASEVDME